MHLSAIIFISLSSTFDTSSTMSMYNLNELAFEAMLENAKQISNGNPIKRLAIDSLSYEHNREQYNDCLRHINNENFQATTIFC